MNICYLASAGSIHAARWANYFAHKGHEVHILSFEPTNSCDANVRVHRVGRPWPLKIHYYLTGAAVRRLLKEIQPDILHAHYASGYATLGRLAGFHPYVVSVWGSDIFDFARKSSVHRGIVVANLNRADRVCSTSQIMAEEVERFCQKEVTVTPFGVDCKLFRPRPCSSNGCGEFVIGVVKALEPNYGIEYLIRGFAAFARKTRNDRRLRLMIVGKGSLLGPLQQLATDLGIGAQTSFLGFVSHEKIPEILNRFSVFVAPTSGSESFGVAVVEASASGLPVVASRIGGLPEVVKDRVTGILVPPRDADAIASALEELFGNEQLRAEFGANGRKFVLENYEWTENANRMECLYESILA
jgi:glycosyltransferase involved in cell wall biosynthesis